MQLLFSQVDACRNLRDDGALAASILLSDVYWDSHDVPSSSGAVSMGQDGNLLEEMITRVCPYSSLSLSRTFSDTCCFIIIVMQ